MSLSLMSSSLKSSSHVSSGSSRFSGRHFGCRTFAPRRAASRRFAFRFWSVALASAGLSAAGLAPQAHAAFVAKTDPAIVGWATAVASLDRGPQNIANPAGPRATFGTAANAIGSNDAVVSLGDGGSITLTFADPITDRPGPDFAVFENGFASGNLSYLELAFVEVSSDGSTFVRFPAVSRTQTSTQVAAFGLLDGTQITNLAGSEIAGRGTPFDLTQLADSPGLDLSRITHVRVVDVIGSIDPLLGSRDSLGNLVNDPYPTAFSSGGFDFDAVAVLHAVPEPSALLAALALTPVLSRKRRRG